MLSNTVIEMEKENAIFARNVEYLKETSNDDILDERIEVAESQYVRETSDEIKEAADMVKKLSGEEDLVEESAELDKILSSETDITFNEMIGL